MIVKNSIGVAHLGTWGVHSEGRLGGYHKQGAIKFNLKNGNWTAIYYFNDPKMAILYNGGWYLHDELPAYMVKRNGEWFVGTYDQLKQMVVTTNDKE